MKIARNYLLQYSSGRQDKDANLKNLIFVEFGTSNKIKKKKEKENPPSVLTSIYFMTMQEKQILARAIGIQKENWGQLRIFQR